MAETSLPEKFATIYALVDPRISDPILRVRYIGITVQTLTSRLSSHLKDAKKKLRNPHKTRWISSLLADGVRPHIESLEHSTLQDAPYREAHYVHEYIAQGAKLLNGTHGGEVLTKHLPEAIEKIRYASSHLSPETRQKRSESAKRRIYTIEERRRLSEAAKKVIRKPCSEETKRKISEAHKGKSYNIGHIVTPETREKIRQAVTGFRHSLVTIEKIRQINTGRPGARNWTHSPEAIERIRQHHLGSRYAAKLTDYQITIIQREYQPGVMTQSMLARRFGVHTSTISLIVRKKTKMAQRQSQEE